MAITIDDFSKIWASTSPLTPYAFSESNYKEGWNFVGSTPPSRQMWDFLQKNNDEKMQYLANNYLPLSGGTMTGAIVKKNTTVTSRRDVTDSWNLILGGTSDTDGAYLRVDGKTSIQAGCFQLKATDGTNSSFFVGHPDGTLTWNGYWIERVISSGTYYIRYESGLQIVWGLTSATTAGTTVTFPVAFANTYYSVIPQTSGYTVTAGYTSKTTTSVVIQSSHATTQAGVEYICIGRWK